MSRILHLMMVVLCACFYNIQNTNAQDKSIADPNLMKVARQYKYGIVREANPEKAVRIYKYLAHKGNVDAMNELGKCYLNGDGVGINTELAFKLFKKAAVLGNVNAKCNMALMYQKGLNGNANYRKAFELYKDAADSGSLKGVYGAGYLLYKGFGVEQNYSEALKYLKEGANNGHSGCSMLLASYYANGYEGKQDMNRAEYYWRKASRDGNSWTVDVTKNGQADSISKRVSRKGSWKHIKEKVLENETMPNISNNINKEELSGSWKGTAYLYDWSKKNILAEKEIELKMEDKGDSLHVEIYIEDSLVTSYLAIFKDGKYVSKNLTEEQKGYPWTVTQTIFEKKGGKLFADIKTLNFKNMSIQKPLLAILSSNDTFVKGNECQSSFSIGNVFYDGNNVNIEVTSARAMDVDVFFTSGDGLLKKQKNKYSIEEGCNNIRIPALFLKKDVINVVTISNKGERHSKTITVESYE